jgi:hypothetical protein
MKIYTDYTLFTDGEILDQHFTLSGLTLEELDSDCKQRGESEVIIELDMSGIEYKIDHVRYILKRYEQIIRKRKLEKLNTK